MHVHRVLIVAASIRMSASADFCSDSSVGLESGKHVSLRNDFEVSSPKFDLKQHYHGHLGWREHESRGGVMIRANTVVGLVTMDKCMSDGGLLNIVCMTCI